MDPHALAVALDELAILPPSALTSIGTLRRVHASLVAAGAQGLHTDPTTDRTAPASGEDVERLHEIFDACASAGAPSTATHYVDEVCGDARVVSDNAVEAYLRDGECVLEWAKKSLTRAAFRLDGASGRPAEARRAAAEEATRTLDALRRATEALGADASGRTASDVAPQFKRLQSVRDEVVCRQLQAEALLWAARGETSDAAGARYGGPAAWAGAVQRRRSAVVEADARCSGASMSTFLDDLLDGVGEHRPAYPFRTLTEAARSIFVDGSASPTALVAKRCLFLYFLLDSGLPHDGSPLEYARQAHIHPRLFQETRAAVLLDDAENEASLDEACALLPKVAHPLLPVKFIASLAARDRAATALVVARARAPTGASSTPDTETIGLDVSIRLACGLVAEAFLVVRDAYESFPELHRSKAGAHLVRLLLDHGVEKLCLEKILSLPFYGDMEDALLELLWNTRDDVPVESGIAYLLDRGRALEAKALFTRAKTEGRLADDHAAKLIERLRESSARLPASQKAFAMDGDVSRKTNGVLPRALVVEDATSEDMSTTASAMVGEDERVFRAVLKTTGDDSADAPFVRPPIGLARSSGGDSSLDQTTAAFASTSILNSPGINLTFVRPFRATKSDGGRDAGETSPSPVAARSVATPSAAKTSSYEVPEPTAYASPFGVSTTKTHDASTEDAVAPLSATTGSLLFGARRPTRPPSRDASTATAAAAFPAFLSPTPRARATRRRRTDAP